MGAPFDTVADKSPPDFRTPLAVIFGTRCDRQDAKEHGCFVLIVFPETHIDFVTLARRTELSQIGSGFIGDSSDDLCGWSCHALSIHHGRYDNGQ